MSSKNKIDKTNAMRLLDRLKLPYSALSYPCHHEQVLSGIEVAEILQVSAQNVYKTLVASGDRTGLVIAVIPSDEALNLKALAKVSGNKRIDMIAVKDIEKYTGYIRGGCSPLGMKKNYPTFVDNNVQSKLFIIFSGGKRGVQIRMTPDDFAKAIPMQFADISDQTGC